MFETVSPAVRRIPTRSALAEALSFSLVVHLAVIGGAIFSNVWKVAFPGTAPAMMISFVLADAPPPPPPPPPPKLVPRQQVVQVPPQQIVAPTVIPEEIPVVQAQVVQAVMSPAATPDGVAGGVDQGEVGGQIGGVVGGVVLDIAQPIASPSPEIVQVARDKPLPMFPLSQVYPRYPEKARVSLWEDDVVVRYVIGKDGRVKSVEVIRPPEHDIFIDPTLRAIRNWRFKPMIRDGQRVEVQHELTIQYRLEQTA